MILLILQWTMTDTGRLGNEGPTLDKTPKMFQIRYKISPLVLFLGGPLRQQKKELLNEGAGAEDCFGEEKYSIVMRKRAWEIWCPILLRIDEKQNMKDFTAAPVFVFLLQWCRSDNACVVRYMKAAIWEEYDPHTRMKGILLFHTQPSDPTRVINEAIQKYWSALYRDMFFVFSTEEKEISAREKC
jgi:hypothetical protein